MQVTDLVVPVARGLQRLLRPDFDAIPRPHDQARQFVTGHDPDRVLLVGNGPAVGFGVMTHELAVPGQLARRLSLRTGRGIAIDLVAELDITAATTMSGLHDLRLQHYDAIVVMIAADWTATQSLAVWRAGFAALLDELRAGSTPSTEIIVLAAQQLHRYNRNTGPLGPFVGAHAINLDAETEQLCDERPGVRFVRATTTFTHPGANAADIYAALAEWIAPEVAGRLDALAAAPPPGSARLLRRASDPELLRQDALKRTGLLDSAADARLERLVQTARDVFGTQGAAVTLLDGERQWQKAGIGLMSVDMPRSISVCTRTIRQDGPYIQEDLAGEPIAELGVRFYAGYPIESPDGFRIGALCVFDPEPRDASTVDQNILAELAMRVQAELWAEAARTMGAPHSIDARDPRRSPRAMPRTR